MSNQKNSLLNRGFKGSVLLLILLYVIGCNKKNPVSNTPVDHKPVISQVTAEPSRLCYGESSQLTVQASDQDNDSLSYLWECYSGYFLGDPISQTVTWVAPKQIGTYRCNVTASDETHTATSGIDIEVMGILYNDFSNTLDNWTKSYCEAWISSEEAHFEGSRSGYYGTLYRPISSSLSPVPEYTVEMKLARVDEFSSTDYYGLYTRVDDTGSITITTYWLRIYPNKSDKNWSLYCFVSSSSSAMWALLDEDSKGTSPLIKTGMNEWNDISWTVKEDKTIIVKVGSQELYRSSEISNLEGEFGITFSMDLTRAGGRTGYADEVKMDDILVTEPPGKLVKMNMEQNIVIESAPDFQEEIDLAALPESDSDTRTLRSVLESIAY